MSLLAAVRLIVVLHTGFLEEEDLVMAIGLFA